jgi:iron complex transport system ATP-binding protein
MLKSCMPGIVQISEIKQKSDQANLLSAENIKVWYDSACSGDPQLDCVTLSIAPGMLTAVIGPNGAGKTALIRTLSRTLAPKSGEITLNGQNLYTQLTAQYSASSISVIPQITEMFLDFTVREIVAMGRAPYRASRSPLAPETDADEAAVDSALGALSISTELAVRSISKVSGGERQRTLVARALAQEAQIILADEPTASLDLKGQHDLLATLRSLAHDHGKTVMVILHDLNAAAEYADQIAILSEGKLVASGLPDAVLKAEMIEEVYGVRVQIGRNPVSGRPNVIVVPK